MRQSGKSRATVPPTYAERINLAIDHVVAHLDEPLRLADIARAAGLSPFHFHRVFQAVVGETLADFVKRVRLERALALIAFGPRSTLTAIALRCGFSSSSDFSRSFKQRFGAAPSVFDIKAWRNSHGSELEALVSARTGESYAIRQPPAQNPDGFQVKVRHIPARTVAYIRVLDPYREDAVVQAIQRLVAWAEGHGLADGQWLGYQWDNPEITSLDDCQYYVAVEAERFVARGEIGRYRFPPMWVAEVEIRGGYELELRALRWLYASWLPASGYVPDDYPGFEAWIGRPLAHGTEYFEIRAQVPIKRARNFLPTN